MPLAFYLDFATKQEGLRRFIDSKGLLTPWIGSLSCRPLPPSDNKGRDLAVIKQILHGYILSKRKIRDPMIPKLEKGGKRNDDTPQHEAVREAFTNAIIHCDLMMDAGILRIEKHDARFVTIPQYPPFCWTELIVNAVAHRDYSILGTDIMVKIFDHHYIVESPGILPGMVRIDNIRQMHFSRNPKIAEFMQLYKLVKEFGEGVDRMFREMAEAGNPAPEYKQVEFMVKVRLNSALREENESPITHKTEVETYDNEGNEKVNEAGRVNEKVNEKVNEVMLRFYWELGRDIVEKKAESRWGSGFMKNLSRDLKEVNPNATCFSETNLLYMKNFYLLYQPYLTITPQLVEQIAQQAVEQKKNAITPQLVEQIRNDLFSVPYKEQYKGRVCSSRHDPAIGCCRIPDHQDDRRTEIRTPFY